MGKFEGGRRMDAIQFREIESVEVGFCCTALALEGCQRVEVLVTSRTEKGV